MAEGKMAGRVRGTAAAAALLLMGLALGACGDDDDRALSSAEFANQGNAICTRHIKSIEDAIKARFAAKEIPLASEIDGLASRTVIPEIERMRDELGRLRPPENDEEDVEDYLSELKRALDDEVKQQPAVMLSEEKSQNAFGRADDLARDAGLAECGKLGERLQASVGARRGV